MERDFGQRLIKYTTLKNVKKKRWQKVVMVLSVIVVFCTTYALILPAITLSNSTFCGLEAHRHKPECYEKTLICGHDENEPAVIHTHTPRVLCKTADACMRS